MTKGRRRGGSALAAAAAALLSGLAGCGSVKTLSFPPVPSTHPSTGAAAAALPNNLRSVVESPVAGVTTTTAIGIGPGQATLEGTVLGPSGPVVGATVQAERIVGDRSSVTDTTTAADGSWSIRQVLGGRYRVRAWQSPSLALTSPAIFFLGGADTKTLTLKLASFSGPRVSAALAPSVPVVGEVDNLVVQVADRVVDAQGLVREQPSVGVRVALAGGPYWLVYGGSALNTDAGGQALFQVSCRAAGRDPLSAEVGSAAPVALSVADCAPAPAPAIQTTSPTRSG